MADVRKIRVLCRRLTIALTAALCGCGGSPITADRIERAIAPTFANLVETQLSRVGLPPVTAASISVTASCRRLTAGGGSGAGDWMCALVWHGPNQSLLRDSYDLVVTVEGCFTATVDRAEQANLGGPTIVGANGEDLKNLLYTFEGCFDTT